MKFLLDTNVCIKYLNGHSIAIKAQIESTPPNEIVTCSIVRAELMFGAWRSQKQKQNQLKAVQFLSRYDSLPFDDTSANIYGELRAYLTSLGQPIGANDYLIASIALANNLILITNNTKEFSRVPNLKLEDWEAV